MTQHYFQTKFSWLIAPYSECLPKYPHKLSLNTFLQILGLFRTYFRSISFMLDGCFHGFSLFIAVRVIRPPLS